MVPITYFSDVLCVWAFIGELRVAEVRRKFAEQVRFEHRFCSVFGDTEQKIGAGWADRGGYGGFNRHLHHSAEAFPEIRLHPELWLTVRPASSMGAHLLVKAAELAEAAGQAPEGASGRLLEALRRAFFVDGRDIAMARVQLEVADGLDISPQVLREFIDDGRAFAALSRDYQAAETLKIQGSPSFVLNEGRQKLYGNVGYRIIEANIQELLRSPQPDQASWC